MAPPIAPTIRPLGYDPMQADVNPRGSLPVAVARVSGGRCRVEGTLAVEAAEFERVIAPRLARVRAGEPAIFEERVLAGERTIQAQILLTHESGGEGDAGVVTAVAIDITAHANLIHAAIEGGVTLPAVLECSTQAIVGVDSNGAIGFCNAATEAIFGYQRDELIGQQVEVLLPLRLRASHAERRRTYDGVARCTPVGPDRDLHALRKDGTEFPVEVHLSAVDTGEKLTIAFVSDVSARKHAEAAQRESARLLQQALRATNSVAWEWEDGGGAGLLDTIVDCIPWGGNRKDAVDPEDREGLENALEAALRGGANSIHADFRARIAGGEYRWYSCAGRVVRAAVESSARAWAGVVTDIEDRRRAERERDLFFTMSPDLLCITSRDGRFVDVNPAFTRLLGWSGEELTSAPFVDRFVHPEDRELSRAAFEKLLREGRIESVENRFLCKDGGFRWLQWNPTTVTEADRIYGVARDVTGQRLAELQSRRLGQLVQASDAFVAMTGPDGRLLFVNQAGLRLIGAERMPEVSISKLIPALEREEETAHWHGECELVGEASGVTIPVEVTRFPIASEGEEIGGVIARDIRVRRANEARLHSLAAQLLTAQEDERSRIARELHDDFTQKLAALSIEMGALRKYAVEPEGAALLARLRESLASISEDVRLLSHRLHPAALEYAGLAGALQSHCHEVARQHGIRVHCAIRHVPAVVPQGIQVALYRIAQEALRNVVRHSGARSATVTLAGAGSRLRLTISDDGCGFEEKPQWQGIGLDSMRERARLIGATLQIHSVPGEGTSVALEADCIRIEAKGDPV